MTGGKAFPPGDAGQVPPPGAPSSSRMLFDWLVIGQVIPSNPAHSVRGPRHSVTKGATPVLASAEASALIESIAVAKKVKRYLPESH
jgi:hypothetical protein